MLDKIQLLINKKTTDFMRKITYLKTLLVAITLVLGSVGAFGQTL